MGTQILKIPKIKFQIPNCPFVPFVPFFVHLVVKKINMKRLNLFFCLLLISISSISQSGWTSLFDGKTLTGWKKLAGIAEYTVEDNCIVGKTVPGSPNTFLVTEQMYGDFILEMDVKIDNENANSGIQLRSHYDAAANNGKGRVYGYQFELDPSVRRWTGGIYDEGRRDWLYPLSLNPAAQGAFRLNTFNHIRVECMGNEIRTWVNGVPCAYIADTVDASGFIALQVHAVQKAADADEKIWWKNIKIKTTYLKPALIRDPLYVQGNIPNYLTPYEKKNGWELIFDGRTAAGWVGAYKDHFPENGWKIGNGELTVLSSEGKEANNGGDIVTVKEYSAFDLSFDFKFTPGANSGVKYFVTLSEKNTGSAIGLEYQVLDDSLHPDAKLGRDGNRTLASLYDLIKAEKQSRFIHQPGQWNTGRIVVTPGNHVEHYLNGIKVLEYERGSEAYRDLVAISKYVIWKNFGEAAKGHILLQDHGNEVSYRSIKIRKL